MDQYPIRRQIADLESQVLSLGESFALLPADQAALAVADLERVRASLSQLLTTVEPAHSLASHEAPSAGSPAGSTGEDQVVWTANRTTRLYAMNAALSLAVTPAQVAQVVVAQALPALSADKGAILLGLDGGTFRTIDATDKGAVEPDASALLAGQSPLAEAIRTLQPVWIESHEDLLALSDGWSPPGWGDAGALAAVPLVVQGRVLGVMAFRFETPRSFVMADRAFVLVLAQQCAAAVERVQLYEQSRQTAALQERHRLARDLHDSVSQALYAIVLSVTAGRANLEKDLSRTARALDNIQSLAALAQADLRALLFDLRVDSVAETGLVNALADRAQFLRLRHGLAVRTELCAEPDLASSCKEALYGIAREALHNAAKHARAGLVELILAQSDAGLTLEVRDDGLGFELNGMRPGHYGLQSMRERAAELGAELKVETGPGQGTRVAVFVPASSPSALDGRSSRCAQR